MQIAGEARNMNRILIAFALALLATVVCSKPASAQNVYVESSVRSDDFAGNAFVFAVKEQLRKSATYNVLDVSDGKSVEIDLVTLKTGDGVSAVSVVTRLPWTDGGSFIISHQLLLVGQSRVQEMAVDLVADTDASLSKLRADFQKHLGKPAAQPAASQR
jgi:hypothetical protein